MTQQHNPQEHGTPGSGDGAVSHDPAETLHHADKATGGATPDPAEAEEERQDELTGHPDQADTGSAGTAH